MTALIVLLRADVCTIILRVKYSYIGFEMRNFLMCYFSQRFSGRLNYTVHSGWVDY